MDIGEEAAETQFGQDLVHLVHISMGGNMDKDLVVRDPVNASISCGCAVGRLFLVTDRTCWGNGSGFVRCVRSLVALTMSATVGFDTCDLRRFVWRYGIIRWYHGRPLVFLSTTVYWWIERTDRFRRWNI